MIKITLDNYKLYYDSVACREVNPIKYENKLKEIPRPVWNIIENQPNLAIYQTEDKSYLRIAKDGIAALYKLRTPERIPHREICGLCHRVSPIGFHVPDEIWQEVVHHSRLQDIHCLTCFIERADEKLIDWDKHITFYPVSLRSQITEFYKLDTI